MIDAQFLQSILRWHLEEPLDVNPRVLAMVARRWLSVSARYHGKSWISWIVEA